MKKLFLFCITLTICTNLLAQSKYYEKTISWAFIHNGRIIFEKSDGNFFLGCEARYLDSDWSQYSLIIDKFGSVVDSIQYILPEGYGTAFFQGIPTEYGYAAIGYAGTNETTPPTYQISLTWIAPNGELIDSFMVGENLSNAYTLCRTPDGGYMIGGRARVGIGVGSTHYPYLMRLDAAGNMLWDTVYQINGWQGSTPTFYSIIRDANNDTYYANARVHAFDNSDDVVWCHIDGNGNILQQRTFGNEQDYTKHDTGDLIRCTDGTFVFPYSVKANGIWNSGKIIKYDAILDSIIWEKEIFPLGFTYNVKELPDGSLIVAGDASESMDNLPFQAAIAHVSADGEEVLWRRLYGSEDYPDYLYDFIITSDGSYFFVGRAENNSTADVYLLKTNCMGLLTEPQANFSTTIDTAALTATFHNLSQFVYPDSIDGGHFLWDFGDGTFSPDINPTHTYAQNGSYVVKLMAVVCSDTSTTVQSVCLGVTVQAAPSFTYSLQNDNLVSFTNTSSNAEDAVFIWDFGDGTFSSDTNPTHAYTQAGEHEVRLSVVLCQDTTVFVQQVTTFVVGVSAQLNDQLFRVLPNPAQDYLVVENHSQEQNATFVLYDLVGRAVLQQSVSTQNNISTQHLPSGVYLYHFLNPQKQILAYGKISVLH